MKAMEIISFEKRTFEEIAAKLDRSVQRVESLCREHGGKETSEWMDNHYWRGGRSAVCFS